MEIVTVTDTKPMSNKDNTPQPIVAMSVKLAAGIVTRSPNWPYSIELDKKPIEQPIKNENTLMYFEPNSSKKMAIGISNAPITGLAQLSICCQNPPAISI